MRIAIVGSGALGGFYGAMLARGGYDIHFLMRRDYETVREKGLEVKSCRGDFYLPQVNCYNDPGAIGAVDLVFIGLKTTANEHYEPLITPLVQEGTMVLTAQNGLGNEERLAELYGAEKIAGGLAFLCSNRTEPGRIEHLDYGHIHIGNYRRHPDDRLRRFAGMLQAAGVDTVVVEDLALARWQKLVWNVPFNGLSTLLDITVDRIMTDAGLRQQAYMLMLEVQAATRAHDLNIEDVFLDKMMHNTDKMKPYYTSMHLDRRAGQPMEIESIYGEPLRRGEAKGVALPGMRRLYEDLLELEKSIL